MFYKKNVQLASLIQGASQRFQFIPSGRRIIEMFGAAKPPGTAIEMRRGRARASLAEPASAF